MEPIHNISDIKESVRQNEIAITQVGSEPEHVKDFYSKWSTTYDEQLNANYEGPASCVEAVARHLAGRPEVSILDIGCGTGLLAERLAEHGFRNIEGLEPSEGMRKKALEKNLYSRMHECYLTDKVDCLETGKYDVVVGCGVLANGHIKPSALSEVIRCLKPGGYAVFITGKVFLEEGPMRQEMIRLEEEGKWKLVEKYVTPRFILDKDGLLFVFVKSHN